MHDVVKSLKNKTLLLQQFVNGRKAENLVVRLNAMLKLPADELAQCDFLLPALLAEYRQLVREYATKAFQGKSFLMFAAERGYVHLLKEILACRGVDVNQTYEDYSYDTEFGDLVIFAGDEDGFTALMLAAKYGKLEAVELLIRAGASIEHKSTDGWTALHLAKLNRDQPMTALLQRGPLLQGEEIYWKLLSCSIDHVDDVIKEQQSLNITKSMVLDRLLQPNPANPQYQNMLLRQALARDAKGVPMNALSLYLSKPQGLVLYGEDGESISRVRAALLAMEPCDPDYSRPTATLGTLNKPVCYAYASVIDPMEDEKTELSSKISLDSLYRV